MRVQFEFTKEDLVDASVRLARRRKGDSLAVWKSTVSFLVIIGVLAFFMMQIRSAISSILGVIATIALFILYPHWQQNSARNSLSKMVDEMMSAPGPYICEVETRDEGLWLRQMDTQIIYEWKTLKSLEETADSVEILGRDGGGVIVRNRAFLSDADRARFVELVRSHLAESLPQQRREL